MMRIGIEASAAVVNGRTGVGTYTANLIAGLKRLGEISGGLELVPFSNRRPHSNGKEPWTLADSHIYPHDQFPSRLIWMQLRLPTSIASAQPDICHFPNYLGPILTRLNAPFVVTMHDMSIYRYPQLQPLKTVAVHRAVVPVLASRAAMIIADSESSRQDILRHLRIGAERVRVVHAGIGPQFTEYLQPGQPDGDEVRRRYGLTSPYVLTVGTLEPRKNHRRLIQAFSSLVQQERIPHHLVIAGARGWKDRALLEEVRRSPVASRIHVLGYVPAADLPALYRSAEAFAFPSLYEGFGLPVLEALACGAPSLISSDPALTEVAGEGTAVVVDAESVQDISAGLYRLLSDPSLASPLRARGFARASQFSWDRCARQMLQLYREVIDIQARG
jgi:glycosyltransferase involved in cell wall biosynthesis